MDRKIILMVTWFIVGFLVMFGLWIYDMRGEEFDKKYFGESTILCSLLTLVGGYISLIIVCIVYCYDNRPFTKFIYKIANIGVNNQKKNKQ